MKSALFILSIGLAVSACHNQNSNASFPDGLEEYEQQKYQLNPGYVRLADYIWEYRLEESDLASDMEWLHKTQKRYAAAFDSIHPNAHALNAVQKADSMASELHSFLKDEDEPTTTYGIKHDLAKDLAFERYHLASTYDKLLANNTALAAEITAWNSLEKHLLKFMDDAVMIEYYGGTFMAVNMMNNHSNLFFLRRFSMSTPLYKEKTENKTVSAAENQLLELIDKRCAAVCELYSHIEIDEENKYCEEAIADIAKQKELLLQALKAWLKERNALGGKISEENTIHLLENIAFLNRNETGDVEEE